jgi:hypothetical protein
MKMPVALLKKLSKFYSLFIVLIINTRRNIATGRMQLSHCCVISSDD